MGDSLNRESEEPEREPQIANYTDAKICETNPSPDVPFKVVTACRLWHFTCFNNTVYFCLLI